MIFKMKLVYYFYLFSVVFFFLSHAVSILQYTGTVVTYYCCYYGGWLELFQWLIVAFYSACLLVEFVVIVIMCVILFSFCPATQMASNKAEFQFLIHTFTLCCCYAVLLHGSVVTNTDCQEVCTSFQNCWAKFQMPSEIMPNTK